MINSYDEKEEILSYKMVIINYFYLFKIVEQEEWFLSMGGSKKHSFWLFLLENFIITIAKSLDSFTVSRIEPKVYFKKKILKLVEQKLRYKRFRVGTATVQYERNSHLCESHSKNVVLTHLSPHIQPLTTPEIGTVRFVAF